MRHQAGIDILRLVAKGTDSGWNEMLNDCYSKNDINSLVDVHRRLSIGMTDLEKTKMNTAKINDLFLRWLRSLEITALRIAKKINPNPLDTTTALQMKKFTELEIKEMKAHKEKRKQQILAHFRKEAF